MSVKQHWAGLLFKCLKTLAIFVELYNEASQYRFHVCFFVMEAFCFHNPKSPLFDYEYWQGIVMSSAYNRQARLQELDRVLYLVTFKTAF